MARGGISVIRLLWVFFVFVAGFSAVLVRLANLQLVDSGELAEESERIRTKFEVIEAKRGNIYDGRHNLLAATNMVRQVGVDPESLDPEDKPNWPKLAQLLGIPYEEMSQKMEPGLRVIDGGGDSGSMEDVGGRCRGRTLRRDLGFGSRWGVRESQVQAGLSRENPCCPRSGIRQQGDEGGYRSGVGHGFLFEWAGRLVGNRVRRQAPGDGTISQAPS